jgi:guanyl-specific ribonuclease Sa
VKFPSRNDGTTFLNREGRLPEPQQLTLFGDYYKEYVVPTPGVSGPGAQRLIYGAGGEIYYTADHYLTFEHLN